jgi:hypothetical protein
MYPQDLQYSQTQRARVLREFESEGHPYEVNTKPYHSTQTLEGRVVHFDGPNQFAWLIFEKQTLHFFSYGIGDRVPFGNFERRANGADTNLSRAKSTNGAAEVVIEGLGFGMRGVRYVDSAGAPVSPINATGAAAFMATAPPTDPHVVAAIAGQCPVIDPGSILLPPQVYSPFNLEDAIFNGLIGYMSVVIEWDRKRVERLGSVDIMPQGSARSLLRSNGVPTSKNVFCVPEGLLWRRDGQTDSELECRVTLEEDCVAVPLVLNQDPQDATDIVAPSHIYLDIVARLYGLEVDIPSSN